MRRPEIRASGEAAFTLIELMIAVAIVTVLAVVSVVGYTRYVKKGRLVEAHKIVGKIQTLQETYFQTNGQYANCSGNSGDTWHPTLGGWEAKTWNPAGASLSGWDNSPDDTPPGLGLTIDGGRTYFSFVSAAGDPTAAEPFSLFGFASSLGIPAPDSSASPPVPGQPWYYVIARADMDNDNDTTKYTELSATSHRTQVIVRNEGE